MRIARALAVLGAALALTGLAAAQPASDNASLKLAPDEIQSNLVKILRTSNKAQTNRYVPKVYNLKNVNPYAVIRFWRRVMEIEEGAWFSLANPDLNGGKLLVVCPEYQIPGLDALMNRIDREGLTSSSGDKRIKYKLKHRDSTDPGAIAATANEGSQAAELHIDDQINAWMLEDTPESVARIAKALETIDQPTPQMEALITVYEVDVSDDGQLGLDYVSWKNGPGRNLGAFGAFAQKEKISTLNRPSARLYRSGKNTHNLSGRTLESTGRNGAYFYDFPSAYFDFLVTKGTARIVTRTKLSVLNRSTALLEVGERILFYHEHHLPDLRGGSRLMPLDPFGDLEALVDDPTDPNETTDDFQVLLGDHPDNRTLVPETRDRSLGQVSTGLFIHFTPTINKLGIAVNFFMSYVNHTGYEDNGTPTVASRTIETVFKIPHDGREITLGGMVRKRRIDSANKIPWLGDIPVLGYLFGGESRLDQKTMVLTTFSARVIEFGSSTVTEQDLATQEYVEGLRDKRTMENNPGFLKK